MASLNPEKPSPTELIQARYGTDQSFTPPTWNSVLTTMFSHRSVRQWLDEEINEDTLRTIVAATQSAPSSSNKQALAVIAIRSQETKEALAEVTRQTGNHLVNSAVVLVFCIDFTRQLTLAQQQGLPTGALDYADEAALSFLDVGIAAQNAALAAESLGLGTVYLGSIRNDTAAVQELLHLPKEVIPAVGLELGVPDPEEAAGVKPRLPLDAVYSREKYEPTTREQVADYDQALARYYSAYGDHPAWSEQAVNRLAANATESTNRKLLRQTLECGGFLLR